MPTKLDEKFTEANRSTQLDEIFNHSQVYPSHFTLAINGVTRNYYQCNGKEKRHSSNIFYCIEGYNYENNVNSEIYHAVWFRIDQKVFVAPCIISDGNNVDDLILLNNHKENSIKS